MPSYGEFTDDCLVALGMVHDDRLWYRDNMLMNVVYQENLLVSQSIGQDYSPAGSPLGSSHKRSTVIVPVTYNETPSDSEWAYLYFDLPQEVYDIPHDSGIFIRYHRPSLPVGCKPSIAGATFTATTLEELSAIWSHRRMSPREDRPYYSRGRAGNADRVRLFGVSPLVTNLLVGLFSAPRFETVGYDEPMRIDPHRMADLKRLVLQMSVWPLGVPQERYKNDGRDFEPNQVINTRPLVSVNDPMQDSGNIGQ